MNLVATPSEAVQSIRSGQRVYLHGMAGMPHELVRAMVARSSELRNVEVVQLHTEGPAPYADPAVSDSFRVNALFTSGNVRQAIADGRADYTPIFLSEVPALVRSGAFPIDVALIQVSPPDRHGYCSLGVSVEATKAAVLAAKHVVAQVNREMPRTHGDGLIHVDNLHAMVEHDQPIPEINVPPPSDLEMQIGLNCANLVENGATIQMGIGAIPNAVLAALHDHKDLGVHTEMFSDGVVDLVQKGVINGKHKRVHPGKIVAGFVLGTRKLYDFVDDNPLVAMLDIGYVNDTSVIRRNPKVTAINSAIEVDLTGQVCADSIGCRIYSGVGGQMDFIRGASLSAGGKPIIALPSVTSKGESRIVSLLKPGAGVVTTRAHVHWVVTEYGAANLHGKSLRERAKALIEIAHPDHRESLERASFERLHCS
ncbi:MAG TPA: acetyl-CoA hydrolase/transferase C-terminal domain-containing protein [Fimbriimonadaceae bacterium]|nr:acetyl-CoA hydrolase/transferase C-terminal domain-containing protein [Fimbriimonadaceae bacterium]